MSPLEIVVLMYLGTKIISHFLKWQGLRRNQKKSEQIFNADGCMGWKFNEEHQIYIETAASNGNTFSANDFVYKSHRCLRWTGMGWQTRTALVDTHTVYLLNTEDHRDFLNNLTEISALTSGTKWKTYLVQDWHPAPFHFFRITKILEKLLEQSNHVNRDTYL